MFLSGGRTMTFNIRRVLGVAGIVFAIGTANSAAIAAEDVARPNPFATLKIGDVTQYRMGDSDITYVFDGRDELGYRQLRFDEATPVGKPVETEWFDELGRKTRRQLSSGVIVTFEPYACFGVDGECVEGAVYSDGRRKTTKWNQGIRSGSINFTMQTKDGNTGAWILTADGVYSFDKDRGTTIDGKWFDHVAKKDFSIRLISGPVQP